jgi:hypothetical protein
MSVVRYEFAGRTASDKECRVFFRGALRMIHSAKHNIKVPRRLDKLSAKHATLTKVNDLDIAAIMEWAATALDLAKGKSHLDRGQGSWVKKVTTAMADGVAGFREDSDRIEMSLVDYFIVRDCSAKR